MLDASEILIVCIVVHVYFVVLTVRSTFAFPVLIILSLKKYDILHVMLVKKSSEIIITNFICCKQL